MAKKRRHQKGSRRERRPEAAGATPTEPASGAIPESADAKGHQSSKLPPWLRSILPVLLIVAAGFAAHGLALKNPFYLDDQAHILKNPRVYNGEWASSAHDRLLTYYVWYQIFTQKGFDSTVYHALNLIVHIATALGIYFAAREFLRLKQIEPSLAGSRLTHLIPFWAAALFAAHPLCSEVVNYAAQTSIALVTCFLMVSAWAMLRWLNTEHWRYLLIALLAAGLAGVSKKTGIWHATANLGVVILVLWKSVPIGQLTQRRPSAILLLSLSLLTLGAFVFFIIYWQQYVYLTRMFTDPQMGWHLLTQSRVFWEYIWRMFVPARLCSDHWIPITESPGDVFAWIGASGIILLVALGVLLFRKNKMWCLLLALTLTPLLMRFLFRNQEPLVEYRTYPTMPWFSLLTVVGIAMMAPRMRARYFNVGMGALVIGFSALSAKRSTVWNSPESIVADIRSKYPLHVRCQSYIQAVEYSKKDYYAIIDRQVQVRETMTKIFAFNKENKHRNYILSRALNSFMFGEQYNAYALIELNREKEAISRVTDVVMTLSGVVKTDQGKAFGALYRVRGRAHAKLGNLTAAAGDYRRALERIPTDRETRALVAMLPPKFQAMAQPAPE